MNLIWYIFIIIPIFYQQCILCTFDSFTHYSTFQISDKARVKIGFKQDTQVLEEAERYLLKV